MPGVTSALRRAKSQATLLIHYPTVPWACGAASSVWPLRPESNLVQQYQALWKTVFILVEVTPD